MLEWIENNPEWVAIFVATLIAELFLGKSRKVRSNSILELIWNIFRRKP